MRRFLSALSLAAIVPLAGCFDVDATIAITGEDQAEMDMQMTIDADLVAMIAGSGEDPCEGMVREDQADGSVVCSESKSGSIEELMSDPDMGEGLTIEKRAGGLVYVAFDLDDLTGEMGMGDDDMSAEERAQMMAMMGSMFEGHAMVLNITGAEVVETNGTRSDDGKTATYEIPLTKLLDDTFTLPETFNALVRPGT
ncbi:hypothetical protein [Maritimibacter fusiformis]|uniref:Lipoprotein n=1 Tax=Maritimibacter fusiformis TaxID=2603819 RepID=A0A5D0RAA4_9RHOB|nr:hypothetical protein [Maritimibacter fusiformis]TYB77628.1 hypothetical protein FVF75_15310 [Maritimibacter fusiformis]